MQSNPQGFQGYCEAKATIPVNLGPGNLADVKRKFYDVGHFPGVIGAIDCTHVRITCPNNENAMAFVNRKQFYSINFQAVCDSDAFITNIVANWPGSTYESRIYENSNIADKLRNGALDGILFGDSGYTCRAYLLIPILNPKNAGTILYISVLGVLLRDALDC